MDQSIARLQHKFIYFVKSLISYLIWVVIIDCPRCLIDGLSWARRRSECPHRRSTLSSLTGFGKLLVFHGCNEHTNRTSNMRTCIVCFGYSSFINLHKNNSTLSTHLRDLQSNFLLDLQTVCPQWKKVFIVPWNCLLGLWN